MSRVLEIRIRDTIGKASQPRVRVPIGMSLGASLRIPIRRVH